MNNNTCDAFELLKQYIIDNHNGKLASGGKEVTKRCHICGDSRDPTDRHMYIGMKDGLIVYNCFKCGGGLVNAKFLNDIGCYDTNLIKAINEQNKLSSKINTIERRYNQKQNYKNNNIINNNAFDKISYINNRLGTNYTINNITSFGIVLSILNFLNTNHINMITRSDIVMNDIDRYFIGFLSIDRNYLIMRRIVEEGIVNKACDKRYVVYNILNIDTGNKYYIIPNIIDPMKHVDIHVAEGPFDILGIYSHLNYNPNSIFICCCGRGYDSAIKYLIAEYGFINFTIHIYADNDVNDNKLRWITKQFQVFQSPILIHRNLLSKDFGVNKEIIQERIYQLF